MIDIKKKMLLIKAEKLLDEYDRQTRASRGITSTFNDIRNSIVWDRDLKCYVSSDPEIVNGIVFKNSFFERVNRKYLMTGGVVGKDCFVDLSVGKFKLEDGDNVIFFKPISDKDDKIQISKIEFYDRRKQIVYRGVRFEIKDLISFDDEQNLASCRIGNNDVEFDIEGLTIPVLAGTYFSIHTNIPKKSVNFCPSRDVYFNNKLIALKGREAYIYLDTKENIF